MTVRQRARYRLDNSLAKGLGPLIGLLAIITLLVVLIAGFLLWLGDVNVNGERAKGIEGVWASLVRTLDPGTMGSDRGWRFRLTSLMVTIAGIFIVSTLIGLLANGISRRLDDLRRGRSRVIEHGHTLLLGWSPKVFILVQELSAAASPNEKPCVVVLANRDMVEMEDQFKLAFRDSLAVRIVTRTGDPSSPQALTSVAPLQAHSVVVLKDEAGSDATTVRTVLALDHLGLDPTTPLVIELDEGRHAKALATASTLNVLPLVSRDWIAMVTARAVQFPSLADVYEDLLNFDGAEVYFAAVPDSMVGRTMYDALDGVTGGAVFGVRRNEEVSIAPHPDTVLEAHDELILVAERRSDVHFVDVPAPAARCARDRALAIPTPARTHILILGWSELGERVLEILDQSLAPGSLIDVVASEEAELNMPDHPFQRFALRHTSGETTDTEVLDRFLRDGSITRVLVLSRQSSATVGRHDADALLTVLELRRLLAERPEVQVTVEITDPVNVDLIRRDAREEFIVGERLVCLLMSQTSQTIGVIEVLRSLMAEDETDIALLPATAVLEGEATMSGTEVAARLRTAGRYLIGAGSKGAPRLTPHLADLTVTPDMDLVIVHSTTLTDSAPTCECDPHSCVREIPQVVR